ncbi:MAG: menaquinone biosynthesis protein [Acidobacteriia bacterium]|nr:menaquinone biosynthesis protein [Terriglobia bacterium]
MREIPAAKPRVCAVSFLNTSPLVWGMVHGPQRGVFELDFQIPAICADHVASGEADIGIIPSFELTRQELEIVPGTGIACHGPVRSILLISKRPASKIQRLAVDSSSRTSVALARVLLARRYKTRPEFVPHAPDLEPMLQIADAALIIGDPALHIDPATLPYEVHDLGAEWVETTGLPMVFAVWAGPKEAVTPEVIDIFRESCRYGRERIEEIVATEAPRRGIAPELVRQYLTKHIVHELGPKDYEGLRMFLDAARAEVPVGQAAR